MGYKLEGILKKEARIDKRIVRIDRKASATPIEKEESLEATKRKLLLNLSAPLLPRLLQLNTQILREIDACIALIRRRRFSRQQVSHLSAIRIDLEEREEEIVTGFLTLLPLKVAASEEISGYTSDLKGVIARLAKKLSRYSVINEQQAKAAAAITGQLITIYRDIQHEDRIAKRIISRSKPTMLKAILRYSYDTQEDMHALRALIAKELTISSRLVREFYFLGKKQKYDQIVWLEEKETRLEAELMRLSKVFDHPKLLFQSGRYIACPAKLEELHHLIKNGALHFPHKSYESAHILGRDYLLSYGGFRIGAHPGSGYIILFPIEEIMKGRLFTESNGRIRVYFTQNKAAATQLQHDSKAMGMLVNHINQKHSAWLAEARGMQEHSTRKWHLNAQSLVDQDFGSRYMKEGLQEFISKHAVEKGIFSHLFAASDIRALFSLDYNEFVKAVRKAVESYRKSLCQVSQLFASGPTISINKAIIMAPASEVLHVEKRLDGLAKGKVYYYHDRNSPIKECITACKKNREFSSPQTKEVGAFVSSSMRKLQTL